jgi:hypothetical protein
MVMDRTTGLEPTNFLPLPLFNIPLSHDRRDRFACLTSHFEVFISTEFSFEYEKQSVQCLRSGSWLGISGF